MPPTTVHMALVGLVGIALLGEHFDAKSIGIVLLTTALLDLDAVVDIWYTGLHRALFHNLLLPAVALGVLAWDVRLREESFVKRRWGDWGVRVWWVAVVGVVVHILHDALYNGANLFWPLHDQFYDLDGQLILSTHDGIVQTFVELAGEGDTERGTTDDTHYYTGVNPTAEETPENVDRRFPLAETGEHLLLTVVGFAAVAFKLWDERDEE